MGTQTTYTIRLIDRVTQTANKIAASMSDITNAAQKASNSISGIGLAAAGIAAVGFFKMGAELESSKIKFETLLQSAEKGNKLFSEINKFADATPFSNKGLQANSTMLLSMNVSANDMLDTLKMLGSVAGTDEFKLQRIAVQYGQVMNRGRLQAQEFNSFAEAGLNIFDELARVSGKDKNFFAKLMEQGKLTSSMVTLAFKAATSEGGKYNGMIDKLSQSMSGKWSTVIGSAETKLAELSLSLKDSFVPILDKAIIMIEKFGKWVTANKDGIAKWGKVIFEFVPILLGVISAIKIFNIVASSNPYGLAIVGIAALIYYVIKLWQNFDKINQSIKTWFRDLNPILRLILIPIELIISAFNNLIGVIKKFASGDIMGGFEQLGAALLDALLLPLEQVAKFIDEDLYNSIVNYRDKLTQLDENFSGGTSGGAGAGSTWGAVADKTSGGTLGLGLSDELKKLQAEGVVSGNIQTFNINIDTVNGIQSLTTTSIGESEESAGKGVLRAIMESLADIRPE